MKRVTSPVRKPQITPVYVVEKKRTHGHILLFPLIWNRKGILTDDGATKGNHKERRNARNNIHHQDIARTNLIVRLEHVIHYNLFRKIVGKAGAADVETENK